MAREQIHRFVSVVLTEEELSDALAMGYFLALLMASSSLVFSQLQSSDIDTAQVAMKTIRAEGIRAHVRFLADGLLEGRAPGTKGYDIAAAYVATQLEGMGLQPAGSKGNWFQPVPLRKFRVVSERSSLEFVRDGKAEALVFGKDYVTEGDPEHTEQRARRSTCLCWLRG